MATPEKGKQFLLGLAVNFGGFMLGNVIGWSSPAQFIWKDVEKNEDLGNSTWIPSVMPLGAAFSQFFIGSLMNFFGRKAALLIMSPIALIGWLCISFGGQSKVGYCIGRFITGCGGGAMCVVVPTYSAEYSHKSIRGTLGVFFQLFIVNGIVTSFALGELRSMRGLNIPLTMVPIIYFAMMLFIPESPVYLIHKQKLEKGQEVLQSLRGKDYNIDFEIKEMQEYTKVGDETIGECLKKKATLKGIAMLVVLNILQQLSGINVVMFFAHDIFKDAGSKIRAGICSIILGLVQVVATGISAVSIDKTGRKKLLFLSFLILGICQMFLGLYFYFLEKDKPRAKSITWLPLVSVCVYIIGFSLGAGPIPFTILGELLPNRIKSFISAMAIFCNWMLAFAVTFSFDSLKALLGTYTVFWIYGVICFIGLVFIVFVLIETKGKSLEDIQIELGTVSQ